MTVLNSTNVRMAALGISCAACLALSGVSPASADTFDDIIAENPEIATSIQQARVETKFVVVYAAINYGELIVVGLTKRPGQKVVMDKQFKTHSDAARIFYFKEIYWPEKCKVTLRSDNKNHQALVQFCGPEGPEGPKGPRGKKGATGTQGPQGETGAEGPEGPEGPQGDRGKRGKKGATGAQGPAGPEGPEGPQGDRGPRGVQGEQGEKGDQGEQGATGAQGPVGPQGPTGVVEVLNFQSTIGDVDGSFFGYRFIGDTVTVTVDDGQRVTGSATAILGLATDGLIGLFVDFDLCYQATSGGPITTFSADPLRGFLRFLPTPYTANASRVFAAGDEFEIGYCADPNLLGNTDELEGNNHNVAGWIMVTNE